MIETTAKPGGDHPVSSLTERGRAADRLSEFQDCWNDLGSADRRWFAEDLRDLLVAAVLPETA